ncbi:MAG: phosphate acetyltransferase [Bacilli bacterium]|nr:phosphate acetyltransferase [Bacilli bacterium]
MEIIDFIKNKAKNNLKTIILPESEDERVLEAARIATKEGIAKIILIGDNSIKIDGVEVIDPINYSHTDELINDFYELRKEKGINLEDAKKLIMNDKMYFACMLLKRGIADGIVSGACHSTSDTLRPALQIIKTKPNSELVSAFFLMDTLNLDGSRTPYIFSDAGLNPNPNAKELAYIAKDSADSYKLLTDIDPIVAFLSYSTKGSAKSESVDKVIVASNMAKELFPNYLMDGELQLDAAIVPEVAKMKAPDSKVAGYANTLIFPDLNAGNIGYKLVQRLGHAKAYGPITQGINKPINDLSRGCTTEDIVGVIAITALQAGSE